MTEYQISGIPEELTAYSSAANGYLTGADAQLTPYVWALAAFNASDNRIGHPLPSRDSHAATRALLASTRIPGDYGKYLETVDNDTARGLVSASVDAECFKTFLANAAAHQALTGAQIAAVPLQELKALRADAEAAAARAGKIAERDGKDLDDDALDAALKDFESMDAYVRALEDAPAWVRDQFGTDATKEAKRLYRGIGAMDVAYTQDAVLRRSHDLSDAESATYKRRMESIGYTASLALEGDAARSRKWINAMKEDSRYGLSNISLVAINASPKASTYVNSAWDFMLHQAEDDPTGVRTGRDEEWMREQYGYVVPEDPSSEVRYLNYSEQTYLSLIAASATDNHGAAVHIVHTLLDPERRDYVNFEEFIRADSEQYGIPADAVAKLINLRFNDDRSWKQYKNEGTRNDNGKSGPANTGDDLRLMLEATGGVDVQAPVATALVDAYRTNQPILIRATRPNQEEPTEGFVDFMDTVSDHPEAMTRYIYNADSYQQQRLREAMGERGDLRGENKDFATYMDRSEAVATAHGISKEDWSGTRTVVDGILTGIITVAGVATEGPAATIGIAAGNKAKDPVLDQVFDILEEERDDERGRTFEENENRPLIVGMQTILDDPYWSKKVTFPKRPSETNSDIIDSMPELKRDMSDAIKATSPRSRRAAYERVEEYVKKNRELGPLLDGLSPGRPKAGDGD